MSLAQESAVGRNDVHVEAVFAKFWGMSRDRETQQYEDLRYVASDREGVHLLPLPMSHVEARKRLLHPCRVFRRQNRLENPAAAEVCRVTIAGHRRGDPRTVCPRTIGYYGRSLPP